MAAASNQIDIDQLHDTRPKACGCHNPRTYQSQIASRQTVSLTQLNAKMAGGQVGTVKCVTDVVQDNTR